MNYYENLIQAHRLFMNSCPIWPVDYGLGFNHCREVIEGEYDLPFNKPDIRILDIGANVGAFVRWAKRRWPDSRIYCYEPHPVNYFTLKRTVKDYGLTDVEINEVAIADRDGRMDFHHNGLNCGEWSLAKNATTHDKMTVLAISAKNLPDADLIKLDTEGAEPEILLELSKSGKLSRVSAIVLEYHSSSAIAPLKMLMEHEGFRMIEFKSYMEHRGIMKFLRCSP